MRLILFLFLLFSFSHICGQSQKSDSGNIPSKQSIASEDVTFMKAQIMPIYKTGLIDLEDTLTKGLHQRVEISKKTYTLLYYIRIRKDGSVDYVKKFEDQKTPPFEKELESALLSTTGMWEPAQQNYKPVNAMKVLRITISERRVTVEY